MGLSREFGGITKHLMAFGGNKEILEYSEVFSLKIILSLIPQKTWERRFLSHTLIDVDVIFLKGGDHLEGGGFPDPRDVCQNGSS